MHEVVMAHSTVVELCDRLSALEREVAVLRALLDSHRRLADRSGTAGWLPGVAPRPATAGQRSATPAAPGHWEVTCLGAFRLRCAGREVAPCSSQRGWSILAYLLASPRYAAPADLLVEALWPQAAPAAGSHNLQMAVHTLRRALKGCGPDGSDDVILFRQGLYRLHPALSVHQDVDAFRAAFERGRRAGPDAGLNGEVLAAFEAARDWYGGPYLADLPHAEWAESRRVALQDVHLSVLGRLSVVYGQAGDWDLAAAACREVLAADPYREDAVRQLMRCHAATGRLLDVQRTYHLHRERLLQDLQVAPADETDWLARALDPRRGR